MLVFMGSNVSTTIFWTKYLCYALVRCFYKGPWQFHSSRPLSSSALQGPWLLSTAKGWPWQVWELTKVQGGRLLEKVQHPLKQLSKSSLIALRFPSKVSLASCILVSMTSCTNSPRDIGVSVDCSLFGRIQQDWVSQPQQRLSLCFPGRYARLPTPVPRPALSLQQGSFYTTPWHFMSCELVVSI